MSTNKTPFTFNIKYEYLEKMRYIAKRETRSLSNLLEHLCKLYIEEYERNNDEIKLDIDVADFRTAWHKRCEKSEEKIYPVMH